MAGFRTAVVISGVAAAAGGVLSAIFIRDPRRTAPETVTLVPSTSHCGLEAPPLAAAVAGTTPGPSGARMGP
jgi:hypothetical protein